MGNRDQTSAAMLGWSRMDAQPVLIRMEQPRDAEAIEQVHLAAFASHAYSRQTEHLIVNALRAAGALAVSLVAEEDGQVIGHIAFSTALINGQDCGWQLLGPVGVLPAHQRQGVGSRLVREGLAAIRRLGARGCVLVGEPAYYCRFGFSQLPSLEMPGVPSEYLLGLSFDGHLPEGTVAHHPAFLVGL